MSVSSMIDKRPDATSFLPHQAGVCRLTNAITGYFLMYTLFFNFSNVYTDIRELEIVRHFILYLQDCTLCKSHSHNIYILLFKSWVMFLFSRSYSVQMLLLYWCKI